MTCSLKGRGHLSQLRSSGEHCNPILVLELKWFPHLSDMPMVPNSSKDSVFALNLSKAIGTSPHECRSKRILVRFCNTRSQNSTKIQLFSQ